ncbi:CaiB/BaiF CoA transferase family protein [Candidatus Foliamicus sp.]
MAGALDGIRVLELTSVVAGPWACQLLADMGADVVKVEPPYGDSNRGLGAFRNPGMAALYLTCNRNKRGIVLDLKQEAGREALLRLARDADVLIHNNRPGVMARLKLDYEDVRAVNSRIIYCGAYGYSKDGPYGERGALDDSIQSISGFAMLHAMVQGEPRYAPTVVADKTTSITVVYAVLAALFHRERTGEGQFVEVPMFETLVSFVMAEHQWGMVFDPVLGEAGYKRLMSKHRKPYKTLDGYIAVLPYMDRHWEKFCTLAERPDLINDERFRTLSDRVRNIDDTYSETGRILATRTTAEWMELFAGTSVPVNAVNTLDDLLHDDHLEAVGFWSEMDHPSEGKLKLPAFPVNFSASPASIRRHPPMLGEHSVELLREAGYSSKQVKDMLKAGVTRTPE